jgi:hypothetical protein
MKRQSLVWGYSHNRAIKGSSASYRFTKKSHLLDRGAIAFLTNSLIFALLSQQPDREDHHQEGGCGWIAAESWLSGRDWIWWDDRRLLLKRGLSHLSVLP